MLFWSNFISGTHSAHLIFKGLKLYPLSDLFFFSFPFLAPPAPSWTPAEQPGRQLITAQKNTILDSQKKSHLAQFKNKKKLLTKTQTSLCLPRGHGSVEAKQVVLSLTTGIPDITEGWCPEIAPLGTRNTTTGSRPEHRCQVNNVDFSYLPLNFTFFLSAFAYATVYTFA